MSSLGPISSTEVGLASPAATPVSGMRSRLADYADLAKPRIAVMAMVTVAVGYVLAAGDNWQWAPLLHALGGIGLAAVASGALNQYLERHADALMSRTASRPIPAGRLSAGEVLAFGLLCATGSLGWLIWQTNPLTAGMTLATLVMYLGIYTPLKQRSSLATSVGAVPGALPPVLGWLAAGGPLDSSALALFAILFLWQFPHFLAIAWLCRDDYQAAGMRMLPRAATGRPGLTGLLGVVYALALLVISAWPRQLGLAGNAYLVASIILGTGYLVATIRFWWHESTSTARGVLYASLVHLPLLLGILTWDHLQMLR
tara:strand:+ start:1066 stop:2010 length:945 start_codon:yes stop_codon:yes gene_type:complete